MPLRLALALMLTTAACAVAAPKKPAAADIDAAVGRVREEFKADYADAKSPEQRRALADKLSFRATPDADAALQYALLSEARELAARGEDLTRVLRLSVTLSKRFDLGGQADDAVKAVATSLGTATDLTKVVNHELTSPFQLKDMIELALTWKDLAEKEEGAARVGMQRRALWWLVKVAASKVAPGGLASAQASDAFESLTAALDEVDAKAGRFSLYEGIWTADYGGQRGVMRYAVSASGEVRVIEKNSRKATLVRRDGKLFLEFESGDLEECRWRPGVLEYGALDLTAYPKGGYPDKPQGKAVARRSAEGGPPR